MTQKADIVIQRQTDTWAEVVGEPKLITMKSIPKDDPCPKCGGTEIAMMEVRVKNIYLIAGTGTAAYAKCVACDWQSEMMARTD